MPTTRVQIMAGAERIFFSYSFRKEGGGREDATHPLSFLRVFKTIFLADAVFSSCSLVLETRFGKVWSESVVKRYDVICSMKTSHFFFLMKMRVFSPIDT